MPKVSDKTHVPASFYGYTLQETRAVYELIGARKGSCVSIEVLEDIAVQRGEQTKAIQSKAGVASNPLADRSVELWKTIYNWLTAVKNGSLNASKTQFVLHVRHSRSGAICRRLEEAQTTSQALDALNSARDELWGRPPKFRKRRKVASSLAPFLDAIFEKEALAASIIANFYVTRAKAGSFDELRDKMLEKYVDEDVATDLVVHALGWARKQLASLIEKNRPAVICDEEFRAEINRFRNKLKNRQILPGFATTPTAADVAAHTLKAYVRQLELIDWPEEMKFRAVAEYLSAAATRAEYAARGWVHDSSFDELENALKTFWSNTKFEQDLDAASQGEVKRGKRLAITCLKHRSRLEGLEVPDYFCPGCMHELADAADIGWHPRFRDLLQLEDAK